MLQSGIRFLITFTHSFHHLNSAVSAILIKNVLFFVQKERVSLFILLFTVAKKVIERVQSLLHKFLLTSQGHTVLLEYNQLRFTTLCQKCLFSLLRIVLDSLYLCHLDDFVLRSIFKFLIWVKYSYLSLNNQVVGVKCV